MRTQVVYTRRKNGSAKERMVALGKILRNKKWFLYLQEELQSSVEI